MAVAKYGKTRWVAGRSRVQARKRAVKRAKMLKTAQSQSEPWVVR
jgi:hypothetical protein